MKNETGPSLCGHCSPPDKQDRSLKVKGQLTESSQLFDDSSQGAVGHTLQFTTHTVRESSATQVPGLDVPLH